MADPIKSSQKTKQTHPLPPLPSLPDYASSRTFGNSSFSDNPQVYMLQIPRDHVLKVPSNESKQQYKRYTYKPIQRHRHSFCRCLCASICLLVLILIAIGCVVYFFFRPKTPTYTLTGFSIAGFEPLLNSSVTPLNPSIIATVQTENPNKRISILYQTGGSVWLHFDEVYLCEGDWPSFHQGPKNVTVFATNLTGSGVLLTALNRDKLVKDHRNGSVPLAINAKVPVKIKFSFITSWLITARVSCDVMVSSITGKAAILSKTCRIKTHYFW
ncbi:Late embryogenesis abundant protein [Carex littledalei]|uniref:Late embryogenesis abundant protein n=1 Tax=Carex littledalei TaxID=544730 RepID=A0A833QIM4_9POAL|nr:Late embryogenesis abundant protein [Carex littledalei]